MMSIAWGALVVFLACMAALGSDARSWLIIGLAVASGLVCLWAFGRLDRRSERPGTSDQASHPVSPPDLSRLDRLDGVGARRPVSPYFDRERGAR